MASLLIDGLSSVGSVLASDLGITSTSTSEQKTTATQTSKSSASSYSTKTSESSSEVSSTATSSPSSTSSTNSSTITAHSSLSSITSIKISTSITNPTSSSISTSVTITTSAPANPVASPTGTSTASLSPPPDGNNVPTAGIAVAAVFAALIISGITYLLWKYLPAAQRYRERKYEERSHRKGLVDEEDEMFDDPKQGLGLRRFSFHTAPTYYPGQPHEPDDVLSRPWTSPPEEYFVSTRSTRGMDSTSTYTLPSALQPGPTTYMPYRDVNASQIGLAVPFRSPRPSDKGLPPLPSIGYEGPFSRG